MSQKLTDQATEAPFKDIIESDQIYEIPFFQRGYKWKQKERKELIRDIDQILQGEEPVHFLGTIILYKKQTGATETNMFEIIDGQQRLTTLYLLCLAIVSVYIRNGEYSEASYCLETLIILKKRRNNASNLKLWPGKYDRAQFNALHKKIWEHKAFKKHNPYKLVTLPDSGSKSGNMTSMHSQLARVIGRYYKEDDGFNIVKKIFDIIFNNLRFINILVNEASNSTKFFERMNARGIMVTTGELVRNEIFSRVVTKDPTAAIKLHEKEWLPFYERFDISHGETSKVFDDFLFAFTLINDPTYTKSRVFEFLRNRWKGKNPIQIIDDMKVYQDIYIQLRRNSNNKVQDNILKLTKPLYQLVDRYIRSNAPTTTLPFVVNLIHNLNEKRIDQKNVEGIFVMLDSYLVKRAVLGFEPTGLHAIFKDLWYRMKSKNVEEADRLIRNTKTMAWPTEKEFEEAIEKRPLYGTRIANYVVGEYDISLKGDHPGEDFEIEHVLPQKMNTQWKKYFSKEEHKEYVDQFANLLPITANMNKSLQNYGYKEKKKRYAKDSKFKSCRQLAEAYNDWSVVQFLERQKVLLEWAKKRWPY